MSRESGSRAPAGWGAVRARLREAWPAVLVAVLAAATAHGQPPATMEECVRYAMEHSRELRKLEIGRQNQALTTRIKQGKFAFGIESEASRAAERGDGSLSVAVKKEVVGGINVSAGATSTESGTAGTDTSSLSLRISKVLLGGGSVRESRLEVENSLLDELIRMNEANKKRRELAFTVRRAFFRLIRNFQTVKVWEIQMDRARKNLDHAIERENPLDIATARIEIPQNEAALLEARLETEAGMDDLKLLIGMDVAAPLEVGREFVFSEETFDVARDAAYCVSNHEDLVNARLEKRKIENETRVLRPRAWPKITLSGTADRSRTDPATGSPGHGADEWDDEFRTGVSMAWEVGGGSERARYRKALNDGEIQTLDIAELEQTRVKRVRELGRRLDEAIRQIRIQEERVKLNERLVALYADRWQNGEISILEYVRSQNDMENSRIQLISRKTAYMELLGEYRFEVGR